MGSRITSRDFGRLPDGRTASLYTIDNGSGISVSLSDYGGIITSIITPDAKGTGGEITLSYDELDRFLAGHPYFGAMIGRVGNRVSGGGFTLDGDFYPISTNAGDIQLHGGFEGFDKKLFRADEISTNGAAGIRLSLTSPDGEEGYPGNLDVTISVTLSSDGVLALEYDATTDRATPINLTNHTYWNLEGSGTVFDQELELNADRVVMTDDRSIPTGELRDVSGSCFDFRKQKTIGRDFDEAKRMATGGYDHCFCVTGWDEGTPDRLLPAATAIAPESGRTMSVWTTLPGFQLYTANKLKGKLDRNGAVLSGHEAFCIETQYYPDSVNRPEFPEAILRPGERFHHRTEYRFSTIS